MTSVTYSMRVYIMFMLCLVCVLYILIWVFEITSWRVGSGLHGTFKARCCFYNG